MSWPTQDGPVYLPAGCCATWKFVASAPEFDGHAICAEPRSAGGWWFCD
jgi:hypothetical protein